VRNLSLSHPELAGDDPTVVAVAASGPLTGAPVPTFSRDDVAGLAAFILAHVGLAARP
jgi:molybdopterin-guanine dinucleotide biosynthesis protein B